MKKPTIIQVCPDDQYFIFQVHLWLESLKEIGKSEQAVSLIFTPYKREFNKNWLELEKKYPEAKFVYYKDEESTITRLLPIYLPLLRPYCLMRYFQDTPGIDKEAIFYCDADILFLEKFNMDHLIDDDKCYLSNTVSYVSAAYFDSKIKDVLPEKLEDYKKRDILNELCELVGISREIAVKNNSDSGGAQYLLKNVDSKFWEKVLTDCIKIKVHLNEVNREFFANESKGFQSWATDMYSVLWNLWFFNKETKVVSELDFAWSTDSIDKIDKVGIFHNAGIASEITQNKPTFFKGKYHLGLDPFKDPHVDKVFNDPNSKSLANWFYVKKIIELKQKYNL